MFGILLSAANVALGFVLRSVIGRLFAYFVLFFITTEFVAVIQAAGILPTASSLSSAFGSIGTGVWYFIDLFAVTQGLPLVVSAYATRFIIRRIPVIG